MHHVTTSNQLKKMADPAKTPNDAIGMMVATDVAKKAIAVYLIRDSSTCCRVAQAAHDGSAAGER